jgi:hypothetical protein
MSNAVKPPALHFSLREFLCLFTAICIGCAALKYANDWWAAALQSIVVASAIIATIVAVLDRGARQASAAGFVITLAIYTAAIIAEDKGDPANGRFLTSELTARLYGLVKETVYFDVKLEIGDRVELRGEQLPPGSRILRPGQGYDPATTTVGQLFAEVQRPHRSYFTAVAHCLWAVAVGYVSAKFARWVYIRRAREQAA